MVKMAGDLGMLQRLADGDYSRGEFVIVPPGSVVEADYSGGVLKSNPTE